MSDNDLLKAVHEIRDLIRLMAEPAIAQRDQKLRDELRTIVGKSAPRSNAVILMRDGELTRQEIIGKCSIHEGELSSLVKKLREANIATEVGKRPKLLISIPVNFFERSDD